MVTAALMHRGAECHGELLAQTPFPAPSMDCGQPWSKREQGKAGCSNAHTALHL